MNDIQDIGTPLYEIMNALTCRSYEGEAWGKRFKRSLAVELAGYQITSVYQISRLKSLITGGRHLPNMTKQQLAHALLDNVAKDLLTLVSPDEAYFEIVGEWKINGKRIDITPEELMHLSQRIDFDATPNLGSVVHPVPVVY